MKLFIALLLLAVGRCVDAHSFLREPVARTAIQTRPEFNAQPPFPSDSSAFFCNDVPQDTAFSTCGRCGEAYGNRDASQGGIYDKNIIVAAYTAGSIVRMSVSYIAAHYGGFQIELCQQEIETDDCFQILNMVYSDHRILNGTTLCTPFDDPPGAPPGARPGDNIVMVHVGVQLPPNVTCNRCTVRWTHRTFFPWSPEWASDNCFTPLDTQTFRNCADVSIV